jgi:hypothetical protein
VLSCFLLEKDLKKLSAFSHQPSAKLPNPCHPERSEGSVHLLALTTPFAKAFAVRLIPDLVLFADG